VVRNQSRWERHNSALKVNANQHRKSLIWAILLLVVGSAAFGIQRYLHYIDQTYAQPMRDLSNMMAVQRIIEDAITRYYDQHGQYPRSLEDLPLKDLRWGDEGSSASDLNKWHYHSDPDLKTFSMTWEGKRDCKLFLGGRNGGRFSSEADFRNSKH